MRKFYSVVLTILLLTSYSCKNDDEPELPRTVHIEYKAVLSKPAAIGITTIANEEFYLVATDTTTLDNVIGTHFIDYTF